MSAIESLCRFEGCFISDTFNSWIAQSTPTCG